MRGMCLFPLSRPITLYSFYTSFSHIRQGKSTIEAMCLHEYFPIGFLNDI